MTAAAHLGRNVRSIRLLQGMKQELFARKMGISQQLVSRLEKRQKIPLSKLQAAAKVLNVSVEAIETFDMRLLFNATKILEELAKKDRKIEELEAELNEYRKSGDDSG